MREILANLGPGLFFLIVAWVLPTIFPHLSVWAVIVLLLIGVVGLVVGIIAINRKKSVEPIPKNESNSIKVVMGNNNNIGQIGHRRDQ
jgi:hypothetical protein